MIGPTATRAEDTVGLIPKAIRGATATKAKHPFTPSVQPSEADKAYAAGVMDSDGCFSIQRSKRGATSTYTPVMAVGMASPTVAEWLMERWGGNLTIYERNDDLRPIRRRKTFYDWRISSVKAEQFLVDVHPYLVLKGRQARLLKALRSLTTIGGQKKHPVLTAVYERVWSRMRSVRAAA